MPLQGTAAPQMTDVGLKKQKTGWLVGVVEGGWVLSCSGVV